MSRKMRRIRRLAEKCGFKLVKIGEGKFILDDGEVAEEKRERYETQCEADVAGI